MNIGRLQRVPLREIWVHEAQSFSTWLSNNLDLLEEVTGLRLSLVDREKRAGAFFADVLAEDDAGNLVVIENQLGATDHDHLGKILTYMSNLDVKIPIWITSSPRVEHEKAVNWLNEISPADTAIFLLKIEAVRIGDSPPAPLFTVIAGPSNEQREIGTTKKEMAERHRLRLEFWKQLLERAKKSGGSPFLREYPLAYRTGSAQAPAEVESPSCSLSEWKTPRLKCTSTPERKRKTSVFLMRCTPRRRRLNKNLALLSTGNVWKANALAASGM